jgi:serine/threonine protein kinase
MGVPTDSDRIVAGRYRLIEHLGSGGMGTVWLAQDELLRRRVAVKEVFPPPGLTESERQVLRERTLREARTAARLSHPNVVTIYDVAEDDGRPWIVMELIEARSLRELVDQNGPLDPRAAARVGLQLLAALRSAHAIGVMHRDVKPGNVLMHADGRAVLADFGIARAEDSPATTTSGVLVGSPSYIAPERAQGERGGPASDLWSLGATLYAAVEGRPPYDRAGALPTLMAVVSAASAPPQPSRCCGRSPSPSPPPSPPRCPQLASSPVPTRPEPAARNPRPS